MIGVTFDWTGIDPVPLPTPSVIKDRLMKVIEVVDQMPPVFLASDEERVLPQSLQMLSDSPREALRMVDIMVKGGQLASPCWVVFASEVYMAPESRSTLRRGELAERSEAGEAIPEALMVLGVHRDGTRWDWFCPFERLDGVVVWHDAVFHQHSSAFETKTQEGAAGIMVDYLKSIVSGASLN